MTFMFVIVYLEQKKIEQNVMQETKKTKKKFNRNFFGFGNEIN